MQIHVYIDRYITCSISQATSKLSIEVEVGTVVANTSSLNLALMPDDEQNASAALGVGRMMRSRRQIREQRKSDNYDE